MSTVVLPLDIDHTCEKKPSANPWPIIPQGTRPNECPACCYVRGRLDERGYLDARPGLKKAGKKASA